MCANLLAILTCMLVLLSGESNIYAVSEYDSQIMQQDEIELPSALADDDSFNELPFEQLRQALREEIEHDPKMIDLL